LVRTQIDAELAESSSANIFRRVILLPSDLDCSEGGAAGKNAGQPQLPVFDILANPALCMTRAHAENFPTQRNHGKQGHSCEKAVGDAVNAQGVGALQRGFPALELR